MNAMPLRPLGHTGLTISALSLGGAQLGQQYGPLSQHDANELVHGAIERGVTFIDTSAYYGQGTSETILGEALSGGWRERVHIGTKAGRLGRVEFDFSPAGMRRCLEASLKRLRTDCVEVLLAHDIEYAPDKERVFDETYDVLQKLRTEGKCKFIGMSCLPLKLLEEAISRCQLDVVISYSHFHLQDDTLATSGILNLAKLRGTAVLNASPLAMGLLTDVGPPPWHPGSERMKVAGRTAATLVRDRGGNISTLGMQYALQRGPVPSTITGASTLAELDANLAALTTPMDESLVADVQRVFAPVKDETW
jgi:L-galactose dehydrogenase